MHPSSQVQESNYYANRIGPGPRDSGTLWPTTYIRIRAPMVLVAEAWTRSRQVLHNMCKVSSFQDSYATESWTAAFLADTDSSMDINSDGLRRTVSEVGRIRLLMGDRMPSDLHGAPNTYEDHGHSR